MSAHSHLEHPGLILREEFMDPLGITPYRLAHRIGVDKSRIYAIIRGHRSISAETAARLSRYFGTSEMFWLNLQNRYDLSEIHAQAAADLRAIEPYSSAA